VATDTELESIASGLYGTVSSSSAKEARATSLVEAEIIDYIHTELSGGTYDDSDVMLRNLGMTRSAIGSAISSKLTGGASSMLQAFHNYLKGQLTHSCTTLAGYSSSTYTNAGAAAPVYPGETIYKKGNSYYMVDSSVTCTVGEGEPAQTALIRLDSDTGSGTYIGYDSLKNSLCFTKETPDACGIISDTDLGTVVASFGDIVDDVLEKNEEYEMIVRFIKSGETRSDDDAADEYGYINSTLEYFNTFFQRLVQEDAETNRLSSNFWGPKNNVSILGVGNPSTSSRSYLVILNIPDVLTGTEVYEDFQVIIGDGYYMGVGVTLFEPIVVRQKNIGEMDTNGGALANVTITDLSRIPSGSFKAFETKQGNFTLSLTSFYKLADFKTLLDSNTFKYPTLKSDGTMEHVKTLSVSVFEEAYDVFQEYYDNFFINFFSDSSRTKISSFGLKFCVKIFKEYLADKACYDAKNTSATLKLNKGFYMGLTCMPDGWKVIDNPRCRRRCSGELRVELNPEGYGDYIVKPIIKNLRYNDDGSFMVLAHRGEAACMSTTNSHHVLARGSFTFICKKNSDFYMRATTTNSAYVDIYSKCSAEWKRYCAGSMTSFGQTAEKKADQYNCKWFDENGWSSDVDNATSDNSFVWRTTTNAQAGYMCPDDKKVYKVEEPNNATYDCTNRWKQTAKISYFIDRI
jgi:hypothetical protein